MKTSFAANSVRPSLGAIAAVFGRIGNTTWGSGMTAIALLRDELVGRRNWLGKSQFGLAYSLGRVAPGTNVFAFIAGMGWFLHGWPGALVSVFVIAGPASAAVVALTWIYQRWQHTAPVHFATTAIIGIIYAGAWLLLRPAPRTARTAALVVLGFLLSLKLGPLLVIVIAGVVGYLWGEPK